MNLNEEDLHDDTAELELLGSAARNADTMGRIFDMLPGEDFYDLNRGLVWDACRQLADQRNAVTPVTVIRHLTATGAYNPGTSDITQRRMLDAAPTLDIAARHARLVADFARRRELLRAVKDAYRTVTTHPGDHTEIRAALVDKFTDLGGTELQQLGGTRNWQQLMDEFDAAHAPDARPRGIDTPWKQLNAAIGGLHGGRMYVIGGTAGDGKTTMALNMAIEAAISQHPTLVFSKEMPTLDIAGRLVAYGAQINLARITSYGLNQYDRDSVRLFRDETRDIPLRVNSDPVTVSGVRQLARTLHGRGQLDLLIVDYLQLMTGDVRGRSAEEEIAQVSTELKRLSVDLNIPVVVPAQLNRQVHARAEQKPQKSDLRGSGRIEQDSDVIMLLWRKPVPDGSDSGLMVPDPHHRTVIIGKNRHGPQAEFELRWNGGYGRLDD